MPRALLYYYDKDLWIEFFKKLGVHIIISNKTTKQTIKDGEKIAPNETCLALKIYLGHIIELKDKCDYILIPRIFSLEKHNQVCTNFNALYDLANNLFDIKILNYNVDISTNNYQMLGFLKLGEKLGFSYIKTYNAYKYAEKIKKMKRKKQEEEQRKLLSSEKIKILLAGHPYNLYDNLIGNNVINFLEQNNITILFSNKIEEEKIEEEYKKISPDIHWTYNKELVASVNYYENFVDGIILISSFPCGPDSLMNEQIIHKIKKVPVITLIFEDLNNEAGMITRLESFIDILKNLKEEKNE
ncbi:MAG: acyl-CoA dehydratase activase-related protein [bacterium]|nr:acyl-CoA dehydratase activase-related protein [bacterium]